MNKIDVGTAVESFGDFIRDRRRSAQLSLRQLAEQTGVSNPYLSQIERGLRKPSAQVLQQLAKALRVSAETMYVRAGMLDPDEDGARSVELAVLSDTGLSERQKTVLLDIYQSFRRELTDAADAAGPAAETAVVEADADAAPLVAEKVGD